MIKAAILAGRHTAIPRLVHLLHSHPDVELVALVDPDNAGRPLTEIFPAMTGETDLRVTSGVDWKDIDVAFLATEPGKARNFIKPGTVPDDIRVIDMTGDYRCPDESHDFVDGICELNRKPIVRGARHVALPDTCALAIALAVLPLAKNLMLNGPLRADIAMSKPTATTGSLSAAELSADIADELAAALTTLQTSYASPLTGTLFEGNFPSGLVAVVALDLAVELDELKRLYDEYYDDHNFTFRVERRPDTTDLRGTNKCFLHLDKHGNRLIITAALDPEVKGSAGNAVHAMNLLFGLAERTGL